MDKEQLRQAKKILKKLAKKGAFIGCNLERQQSGVLECYELYHGGIVKQASCQNKQQIKKPAAVSECKYRFSKAVFETLRSLDWIAEGAQNYDGEAASKQVPHYTLSAVGQAALRRILAGGNDFITQHQTHRRENRTIEGQKQSVTYVDKDSPLAWLARRKDRSGQPMISPEALQAGLRLERDFYFAGLEANVTANWSLAGGNSGTSRKHGRKGGGETADHILDAKERMSKVMTFLGSEIGSVLLDVCCFHQGLEQLEKTRCWPKRSGKVVLQLGLHRLAEYYGLLTPPEQAGGHYRALSSWGAEDYRPKIQPKA